MARTIAIATSGVGGNNEDWWQLVIEDDGAMHVLHEWSHLRIRDFKSSNGSKRIPIDQFLANKASPEKVKRKLELLLAEQKPR